MEKYLRIFFPNLLESPSSCMTLQLLHHEFPNIWGKFDFLFYQCVIASPIIIFLHFPGAKSYRVVMLLVVAPAPAPENWVS
jgi:hypothetical protein